jgi:hypothetical protein
MIKLLKSLFRKKPHPRVRTVLQVSQKTIRMRGGNVRLYYRGLFPILGHDMPANETRMCIVRM